MQDPNEDTEWNDILRRKGIIPEKTKEKEVTEDQILDIVENTINEKTGRTVNDLEKKTLDELDELEDEEDERVILEYRRKRIAEMQELARKGKYGEVKEISAEDYVQEVNNAGDDVWVVLHLYKSGIPLCSLINQYLTSLARKFPTTKFLKRPIELRGMKLTEAELEWMLGQTKAVQTQITEDPRPKVKDVLFSTLQVDNDSNDW
ncbi:hypothetical protein KPH14_008902 [Odynerus spinipes]|uniref:Phosducin domain-containing protein n=1 Tax=Odynerus spinipes TaxID=1348599 RepID=A0AAD9VQZ1_9HYME|nr:hypothetical protein KPH14_008902 [Odynerus spinipes]